MVVVTGGGVTTGGSGCVTTGGCGSVSFRDQSRSGQASAYQKLYQAAEIRSRSAATRCTWMTRRRASEMVWLM